MTESTLREKAAELLHDHKGDDYAFGQGATDALAKYVGALGKDVIVYAGNTARAVGLIDHVDNAVRACGGTLSGVLEAARPNSPVEDVLAMAKGLDEAPSVDCAIVIGGGSAIDAFKAANTIHTLGGTLDEYYGVGLVNEALAKQGKRLVPSIAIMTAASSAAHLTRYSNITDLAQGQKKLIIDDALVPTRAIFDYPVTTRMSKSFTLDGAMDGVSHSLEVYLGATGSEHYDKIEQVALTGIELIVTNLDSAVENPNDLDARTALGLGTDLGGVAIMTGGTSGPHLNSFSMVDILPHGRAVAILNPYYVVYFAPACEPQLAKLADLYTRAGYLHADTTSLRGRDLGLAVSEAMLKLAEHVGFPTRLEDVEGFDDRHVERCLSAAKLPALRSKLENMPVPMTPESVDEYMGSVLDAAATGEPGRVKNQT